MSETFDCLQNNKNAGFGDDGLQNTLINNDSMLFGVYIWNIACIHCGCYDGRSIECNEYFKKAEKSTISKIQN